MRIYISHQRKSNFQEELYEPLKNSDLAQVHSFIFPHDDNPDTSIDVKSILENKKCDLVLAEVSYPATGQGIELGYANVFGIPIVCIYKKDSDISGSLKFICKDFIEYTSSGDMIEQVGEILDNYK